MSDHYSNHEPSGCAGCVLVLLMALGLPVVLIVAILSFIEVMS